MKIVNTGSSYRIYTDDLKTYDQLPVNTYLVNFNKMNGFYLELYPNIYVKEKIYGVHEQKVDKILNSFQVFNRNLGVILSGDKGIGKSICAKLLSEKAISIGYPTLIVNTYVPGIADYLASITQEVVILFDEFDKTFSKKDDYAPQDEMLTLFDGLAQGKKLFVVTCNEVRNLNDYLVNRPGRFHYHLRFDYPTAAEITEYLTDKISNNYYSEIAKVVDFSAKVKLNYDCLRSIAFELEQGIPFEAAITDLNIVNIEPEYYNATIYFTDGAKTKTREFSIDLFSRNSFESWLRYDKNFEISFSFIPCDASYDTRQFCNVIYGQDLQVEWEYDSDDVTQDEINMIKNKTVSYMTLEQKLNKSLHYLI